MTESQTRPWWREPMVLLVISGPAVVVVASFISLSLALIHPDPPLATTHVAAEDGADQPAIQARNHAAQAAAAATVAGSRR